MRLAPGLGFADLHGLLALQLVGVPLGLHSGGPDLVAAEQDEPRCAEQQGSARDHTGAGVKST